MGGGVSPWCADRRLRLMGNRWWDKGYTWQGLLGITVAFAILLIGYMVMGWASGREVAWFMTVGWSLLAIWSGWRTWRLYRFTKAKEAALTLSTSEEA